MSKKIKSLYDLKIAHQELVEHHKELEKCTAELKTANENLNSGEMKRTALDTNLEEIMFTISHRVRSSVANILGISNMICEDKTINADELREMLQIIIKSAESLNISTEELSKFTYIKRNQ
jgi:signal transduction histidine kinase